MGNNKSKPTKTYAERRKARRVGPIVDFGVIKSLFSADVAVVARTPNSMSKPQRFCFAKP